MSPAIKNSISLSSKDFANPINSLTPLSFNNLDAKITFRFLLKLFFNTYFSVSKPELLINLVSFSYLEYSRKVFLSSIF